MAKFSALESTLDFAERARGLIWKFRFGYHRMKAKKDMKYAFSLFLLGEGWSEYFIFLKQRQQFQYFLDSHPA